MLRPRPLSLLPFALLTILPPTVSAQEIQQQQQQPYTLQPTEECPILGPIWPSSTYDISKSNAFAAAVESFPQTIETLFEAGVIDNTTSTFALDVYDTRTNASIYSYFHLATSPAQGADALTAGTLDDQTVFRTGSVSKLHTVYAILLAAKAQGRKGLDVFDDPVGKWVPELLPGAEDQDGGDAGDEGGATERIKWEEITIGALARQMGGVGGPSVGVATCGCTLTSCDAAKAPECAQKYMAYLRALKRPVHPIWGTATYADAGFIVLTQVLVSMTSLTYDEAVKKYVAEPLGMNVTGSIAGEAQEANAVALEGSLAESNWGIDNQVVAGSGGIYSNLHDLRKLGLSILNYELLDPRTTREWMKPSGFTGSPYKAFGGPWEIERLAIPVSPHSNRTRITDQYTKAGGQAGYTSVLLLSPDHGLGYSVLVAGPGSGSDRWPLRAALGETFVPAAEWAGYEHAQANWPGTYFDGRDESSNLTLVVREDHPGVGLDEIFIGGIDWRANLTSLYASPLPPSILANVSTPMYPTGLAETTDDGCQRLQFRATPMRLPFVFPQTRAAAEGGSGLFDDVCSTPASTIAFFNDGKGRAIDEFVLTFNDAGEIKSVEYPSTGSRFVRTS